MVYQQLFLHHFKEFFRSKQWGSNLAFKIFSLLGFLVLAVEFIAVGWFGSFLLREIFPGKNIIEMYTSWVLFYFLIEFTFRFFFQSIPILKIQPYLHLNISKNQLVHFLLGKSVLSYFNLFYLLIAIPFGIKNLLVEGHFLGFINWVAISVLAVLVFNFLALLVKRTFGIHWISTLLAIAIVGLLLASYILHWIDFQWISSLLFNNGILSLLILILFLVSIYLGNFKLQIGHIYIYEESKSEQKLAFIDNLFNLFKSNSIESELVMTDLKLIVRNKRPRMFLFMPILFFIVGFLIPDIPNAPFNNKIQFIIMSLALLQVNFGQIIPSWESMYYDGLMTKNLNIKTYLRAKYYVLVLLALLGAIPLLFTLFISLNLFIGGLCVIVYAIGVNSIAFIGISNHNHKRLEINESAWFNSSKNGNMGYMFLISFLPFLIYLPFMLLKWYLPGAYVLAGMGIIAFFFHGQFLKEFEVKYKESKYKMLEGFRSK